MNHRIDNAIYQLCSGYGKYHTDEPNKPITQRKPYVTITRETIQRLIDTPQNVDKKQAQWFIPSTQLSRTFKTQEESGQFYAQWADIDKVPPTLDHLASVISSIIGGADFECYTSKSATSDYQKSRALIWLPEPLCGSDWLMAQQILNDKLEAAGITPDRKSEGTAQLCYLPNRGDYYNSAYQRNGIYFDPISAWADDFKSKQQAIVQAKANAQRQQQEAQKRRESLRSNNVGGTSESLIETFNQSYTPHDILLQAGYDQRGDTFRHPMSESGTFLPASSLMLMVCSAFIR